MDKTDRLRDYGLAFLLYEHGLGVCGYELIRELFIFIKLILNSYLGYNLNNWNFELGTRNPFSTFVKKREYTSDIYSSYSRNYGPKINDHVFYVNVSYRFNWGKKHTFKQIEIEKTRNSAILKANE